MYGFFIELSKNIFQKSLADLMSLLEPGPFFQKITYSHFLQFIRQIFAFCWNRNIVKFALINCQKLEPSILRHFDHLRNPKRHGTHEIISRRSVPIPAFYQQSRKRKLQLLGLPYLWQSWYIRFFREINFGHSRSEKSVIFAHLETSKLWLFMKLCTFWKLKFYQNKIQSSKISKKALFDLTTDFT